MRLTAVNYTHRSPVSWPRPVRPGVCLCRQCVSVQLAGLMSTITPSPGDPVHGAHTWRPAPGRDHYHPGHRAPWCWQVEFCSPHITHVAVQSWKSFLPQWKHNQFSLSEINNSLKGPILAVISHSETLNIMIIERHGWISKNLWPQIRLSCFVAIGLEVEYIMRSVQMTHLLCFRCLLLYEIKACCTP